MTTHRRPRGIHHLRRPAAWSSLLALLLALLFAGLGAPVPLAAADDDAAAADGAVSIAIDESTAVVTADSGFHIALTVTNGTDAPLEPGTLTLSTNTGHVFMSRTDIQDWAQGDSGIPAGDVLGSADVPALDAGAAAAVSVDVPADDAVLRSFTSWGPKPLLVTVTSGMSPVARTYTFLTRSQDGLQVEQTPPMGVTVVMPLTGATRSVDGDAVDDLLDGDEQAGPFTTVDGGTQTAQRQAALLEAHPGLQTIADPTYLTSSGTPLRADAVMQPADFDITAYAALDDADAYAAAGVTDADWDAAAATADAPDDGQDASVVAWQGAGRWTSQALTVAKRQGYDVVIADGGFNDDGSGTVHTGKYEVDTDAGTVTVLSAQDVLSGLARGQATSAAADGERTEAGRLARFVAQSAFYQMEQPYTPRNLLVCLAPDTDAETADALMRLIEQSPWLQVTDLATMLDADAYATGVDADMLVPDNAGMTSEQADGLRRTLESMAAAGGTVERLSSSVLVDEDSSASAQSEQNANIPDERHENLSGWIDALHAAYREFALHALARDAGVRDRMLAGAQGLSDRLLGAVTIMPLESMTVLSETASMPVSVRNDLPYAVNVDVSSITDSPQIVTSRKANTTVPSGGESQITFTIRVVASGSATAHLILQDRAGATFGTEQSTTIASSLRISDMSGFVIIAIAVVLGLLGLWRQFHRKKDPDE